MLDEFTALTITNDLQKTYPILSSKIVKNESKSKRNTYNLNLFSSLRFSKIHEYMNTNLRFLFWSFSFYKCAFGLVVFLFLMIFELGNKLDFKILDWLSIKFLSQFNFWKVESIVIWKLIWFRIVFLFVDSISLTTITNSNKISLVRSHNRRNIILNGYDSIIHTCTILIIFR